MEIWKDIKDYEGLYQISTMGRVKALKRLDSINRPRNEKILNLDIGKNSYARVTLFKDGKRKRYLVHRLVAETFIENPNKLPQVNHINGKKKDNRVENLEWVSVSENAAHAFKTGLSKRRLGKESKLNKPILQYDLQGNLLKRWEATMDIERGLGVRHEHISRCCKGKQQTAGGFKWRYEEDE